MTATWRKRPGGPKPTSGTSLGYSGVIPQAGGVCAYTLANISFCAGGWFFIDERTRSDDSSHTVDNNKLILLANQYAEAGSYFRFTRATGLWTPALADYHSDYTIPIVEGTGIAFGYNQWVFVCFAKVGSETRWYYKLPGGALTQWQALPSMQFAAGKYFASLATGFLTVGAQRWAGRLGMMFTASIAAFADVVIPVAWVDPPTTPNTWYCKQSGTGTGDGTSTGTAWSPSQMADELANAGVVPTSTPWKYTASGIAVPFNIDVRDFDLGVQVQTLSHHGDVVLVDPEGAEIRTVGVTINTGCEGVQIRPVDGVSQMVFNHSALAGTWTNVAGNVWKVACALTWVCLWEDSKWLLLVKGTVTGTLLAALAEAETTSFSFDGSFLYLALPDATNPNTNGRVYEVSAGTGFRILAASTYIQNLKSWKSAKFQNSDGSPANDYPFRWAAGGRSYFRGIEAGYGSKHCLGTSEACSYPNGSRTVVRDILVFQAGPYDYVGFGGQTAAVLYTNQDASSSSTDNQILWDKFRCLLNSGDIGSADGKADTQEPGWYSHTNNSGTVYPYSLIMFRDFVSTSTLKDGSSTLSPNPYLATADCEATWGSGGFSPGEGLTYVADTVIAAAIAGQLALDKPKFGKSGLHSWMPG